MSAVSSRIFFGQAGAADDPGPKLWQLGAGADDDGEAFELRALSNWAAPAGAGGECLFKAAYITITWTKECTIQVTPIVDNSAASQDIGVGDLEVVTQSLALAAIIGERRSQTFEIPFVVRYMRTAVEMGQVGIRGQRLRVLIESAGLETGDLLIDGCEVEWEAVRESMVKE